MKKLYCVRHGQSEKNVNNIYDPTGNEPLTELGKKQAESLAERFLHIELDVIYSSKFLRAKQTAEVISKTTNTPHITLDFVHEYQKYNDAIHAGKDKKGDEIKAFMQELYKAWEEGNLDFDKSNETPREYLSRLDKFAELLENSEQENILLVSHEGFIRALAVHKLFDLRVHTEFFPILMKQMKLSNTGIVEFEIENGKWILKHWNDVAHL